MSEDFPSYEELEAKLWMAEHERDQLRTEYQAYRETAVVEADLLRKEIKKNNMVKDTWASIENEVATRCAEIADSFNDYYSEGFAAGAVKVADAIRKEYSLE